MTDQSPFSALPVRRRGDLLREARKTQRLSTRVAAERLGVTRRELQTFERGDEVPDSLLPRIADVYSVSLSYLVPPRRGVEIDREHATLRVGRTVEKLPVVDPAPDDILAGYLHMLYTLRGVKAGETIPLRDDDLTSLAEALGSDPETIEDRLIDFMGLSREEARALRKMIMRRRVLAPAASIMLAGGLISGLSSLNADSTGNARKADEPAAVGKKATPTTDAPVATTAPAAVETAPPVTAAPVTATPAPPAPARKATTPEPAAPVIDAPGESVVTAPEPTVTVPPFTVVPETTPDTIVIDAPGDSQASTPGS